MKIIIESTTKIVELNGVPARIWEGTTESGIKLHCFITRLAIDKDEPRTDEFDSELLKCVTPSPDVAVFPSRLVL